MAQEKLIRGVVPALITPFDSDRRLNTPVYPQILRPLLDAGVAGIFACGASAEPTTMTMSERMKSLEAIIAEVDQQVPIIAHVGATDIAQAIQLAQHAQSTGANAIGTLPPLHRGPIEQDIIFYSMIGAATDLPFYVYWRADMATTKITPEQFLDLMKTVPNFSGIKFTDPDFDFLQKLITLNDGKLNCLTGPDEMFVQGLLRGSDGAIGTTYNFMPNHFVEMYQAFLTNKTDQAMRGQVEANELISLLVQYGVITGTKAIMERKGMPAGPARLNNQIHPYRPLSDEEIANLMAVVDKFNLQ